MNRPIAITIFALIVIEIFSVRPHRPHIPLGPSTPNSPHSPDRNQRIASGVIHVHSTFSDGGGVPMEIARAGIDAGLDFVILTDHNDSRSRRDYEKRYDSLDLFVEMEASTPAGHAITFYSHTNAKRFSDPRVTDLTYEHFIGQPSPQDFFICASHPSNLKNPWTELDRYPDGMEIANFDSFWQRQASESLLSISLTAAIFPFNNYLGAMRFFQFYRKDIDTWDGMNIISPGHFGIIGHDTHSRLKLSRDLVFRWPDYLETFQLASNVVFLDEDPPEEFEARKSQLYKAIRRGAMAVHFRLVYPFAESDWNLTCGNQTVKSGGTINASPDCHFQSVMPVHFPYPIHLRLVKDGKIIHEETTEESVRRLPAAGPGVYRLEVYARMRSALHLLLRSDVPYLFYNPIYIR